MRNRLAARSGTLFGVDTPGWNASPDTRDIIYGDSYGFGRTYIMSRVSAPL